MWLGLESVRRRSGRKTLALNQFVGRYVLFAGGMVNNISVDTVDVYVWSALLLACDELTIPLLVMTHVLERGLLLN